MTQEKNNTNVVEAEVKKANPIFKSRAEKTFADHVHNWTLDLLAGLLWIYLFLKLFVFDFDLWIFQEYFPSLVWLFDYKFVIFLGFAAIALIVIPKRILWRWFWYILFYPMVCLVKLGIFLYHKKSWVLLFALANGCIAFFRNFKRNIIVSAMYLVSCAVIVVGKQSDLIAFATCTLILLILYAYLRCFMIAFQPSEVFRGYTKLLAKVRGSDRSSMELEPEMRLVPQQKLTNQQLELWSERLQTAVFFNRICFFVGTKLKEYQESPWRIVSPVINILFLLTYTILTFSLIYYGLFKYDNSYFIFTDYPVFFSFFYYSFSNVVVHDLPQISAALPVSQSVYMLQVFLVLILGLILVTLMISHHAQKYSRELNRIVEELGTQEAEIEDHIRSEFGMESVSHALSILNELKTSLVWLLYALSANDQRPDR